MNRILLVVAALLVGCGSSVSSGSSGSTTPPVQPYTPVAAQGFDYQDPTNLGWCLVRNPASTVTRLVLDLRGPAGFKSRGVGLNLKAPAGVRFGKFDSGLLIRDAGVYQLTAKGSIDPNEPVAIMGGVLPGNVLSVGIYQKDRDQPAQDSGQVLAQIALEFDPAAGFTSGTPLEVSVVKAKVITEDIGTVDDSIRVLQKKVPLQSVTIAVGKVVAL
jgi:hypothetical protein